MLRIERGSPTLGTRGGRRFSDVDATRSIISPERHCFSSGEITLGSELHGEPAIAHFHARDELLF
jgi:hypothetical protein